MSVFERICDELGTERGGLRTRLAVESIALAVLYYMRHGYTQRSIELIARDDYLGKHLPPMNALSQFKLDKKRFTDGERLLIAAYDKALRRGTESARALAM